MKSKIIPFLILGLLFGCAHQLTPDLPASAPKLKVQNNVASLVDPNWSLSIGGSTLSEGSIEAFSINRGRWVHYTDDFADLSAWTAEGTVTVSGGVVSLEDTDSNQETINLEVKDEYAFVPVDKPYVIYADIAVPDGQKLELKIVGTSNNVYKATVGGNGNNTLSLWSYEDAETHYSPTNWEFNNKFKLLALVNPPLETIRTYLYWKDTSTLLGRMEEIGSGTSWDYDVTDPVDSVKFSTGGAGTGTVTVENFKIFTPHSIIIGDSIATGHPNYDPIPSFYATNYNASSIGYWVEKAFDDKIVVLNQGIGGDDTSDVLARYESMVLPFDADYVFLYTGTNDYLTAIATSQANLTTIVDAIIADGSKVVLFEIGPVDSYDAAANTRKDTWNTWLVSFCSARSSCYLVQHHDSVEDGSTPNTINGIYSTDGTHYNTIGYRLIGEKAFEAIVR
jgi:lysophospholipase L1-like esterase